MVVRRRRVQLSGRAVVRLQRCGDGRRGRFLSADRGLRMIELVG